MKTQQEFIEAEVTFLSLQDGGRMTPLSAEVSYQGKYRPHIVLQPREVRQAQIGVRDGLKCVIDEYFAVAFWNGPDPIPVSTPFTLTMFLMHAQHPAYDRVVAGAEFTLREGAKI